MGRWQPKPLWSRFIKRKRCISGGFLRWAGIVEYGPLAAKAALEQIYKEKALYFRWVCEMGWNTGIWAAGSQSRFGADLQRESVAFQVGL
jgi:hypothetical protein